MSVLSTKQSLKISLLIFVLICNIGAVFVFVTLIIVLVLLLFIVGGVQLSGWLFLSIVTIGFFWVTVLLAAIINVYFIYFVSTNSEFSCSILLSNERSLSP